MASIQIPPTSRCSAPDGTGEWANGDRSISHSGSCRIGPNVPRIAATPTIVQPSGIVARGRNANTRSVSPRKTRHAGSCAAAASRTFGMSDSGRRLCRAEHAGEPAAASTTTITITPTIQYSRSQRMRGTRRGEHHLGRAVRLLLASADADLHGAARGEDADEAVERGHERLLDGGVAADRPPQDLEHLRVAARDLADERRERCGEQPGRDAARVHESRIEGLSRHASPNELDSTGPAVARPARPGSRLAPWSRTDCRPNTAAISAAAKPSGTSSGRRSFST